MNESNASYMYVGNVTNGASDGDAINSMAAGSVAVCKVSDGTVEETNVSTGIYKIAQKLADGTVIFSPEFDMSKIKNVVGRSYSAPVQEVMYLGYNGTSGELTVEAAEDYVLHIDWLNAAPEICQKGLMIPAGYRTTAASQAELSLGLLESLDAAMKRQPYEFVIADRINAATVVATNDFLANATVVNGLNAITVPESAGAAADAGEYATSTATVVGDYLRIGGVGAGTALTDAVYKVTAVSGISGALATITLDRPVKLPSGTYAAATSDIEVIPAATAIAADFGLKFTGAESTNFDPISDTYKITRFDVLSSNFAEADFTVATKATKGSGYWKDLAATEVYAQFLDKMPSTSKMPRTNIRSEISSAKTYDVISFDVNEVANTFVSTGHSYSKMFHISIATDVALAGDDVDTVFGVTV